MSKLLKEHNIGAVPHGFRSSFRSWCADTGVAREVAEAALGHVVASVEGAYQRSDLLQARLDVIDRWANYLTAERPGLLTRGKCRSSKSQYPGRMPQGH